MNQIRGVRVNDWIYTVKINVNSNINSVSENVCHWLICRYTKKCRYVDCVGPHLVNSFYAKMDLAKFGVL